MFELEERRDISSPLTSDMLRPFTSTKKVLQWQSQLSDSDFQLLGEWLRGQEDVGLRVYGSYDGSISDLEFLRFLPNATRFSADALYDSLKSLDGLRHVGDSLESLTIGRTKARLDLRTLSRFGNLRSLQIEGQTKGIETISSLTRIEELTLRSITLPDLALLTPLRQLRALKLKLGGTRDLGLLPQLDTVEYLELWMVKGLEDVSAIAALESLKFLFMQSLARISALPSLARNTELRRVHLETMKGLQDLSTVAGAPALNTLLVIDCSHLRIEDFAPFVAHPSLREGAIGTGSVKRNRAIAHSLGLQEPDRRLWREVCS